MIQCERCQQQFKQKVGNQRFCSKKCFDEHRFEYSKELTKKNAVERNCRHCGNIYKRVHVKSGFCSISCGSKWNIEHGICDKWRYRCNPKTGTYVKCEMCENTVYIGPKEIANPPKKVCSKKCKSRYMSALMLSPSNKWRGRKLSKESLAKQKETLFKNHGVTNAYFLSVHRQTSKAQQEIFQRLTEIFPKMNFQKEKFFYFNDRKFFIDIVSDSIKLAIEYNGDYWHCNPNKYSADFFHPKKLRTAKEIWDEDMSRMKSLEESGYNTVIIWESDYVKNKEETIKNLISEVEKLRNTRMENALSA